MDDLQFIRTCVDLDPRAWEEFLARYSRLIYSYIHRVSVNLRGFQRDDPFIKDTFQGLLQSLLADNARKLRSFKALNDCSFASWLRLVTINYTLSCLRKHRPMVPLDEEHDGISLKDIIRDDHPLQDESAIYREHAHKLKECIKKLDKDDKLFVHLHVSRGLNLEAVRQVFRISRTAVDMRKSRLVQRLRECFKAKGVLLED
jgi:RNA polymerase sigma factor (sigma-70 family)